MSIVKYCFQEIFNIIKEKKNSIDESNPLEKERLRFNQEKVEKISINMLEVSTEFIEIFNSSLTKPEKKSKIDKKKRRKSIRKSLNKHRKKSKEISPFYKIDSGSSKEFAEMSFMKYNTNAGQAKPDHMQPFFEMKLQGSGLDTTIACISDGENEEDTSSVEEFHAQIDKEVVKKGLKEIYKEFNDISVLLFARSMNSVLNEYRKNPIEFEKRFCKSRQKETIRRQETGTFENRILSESINMGSPYLRGTDMNQARGKETQLNYDLSQKYLQEYARKQSTDEKGKYFWIETIFWIFLISAVLILVLFITLFYCNVFSG